MNQIPFLESAGFPILSTMLWLPIAVAAAAWWVAGGRRARAIALAGAMLQLGLSLLLVAKFQSGTAAMQFVERIPLLGGVSYHLAVDGLSLLFLPLTAIFMLLLLLEPEADDRRRVVVLLALETCTLGMLTSIDVLAFTIWFILEMWPAWLLIALGRTGSGSPSRGYYLTYMASAGCALLMAVALLGLGHYQAAGTVSFDLVQLLSVSLSPGLQKAVFILMFIAFAVRVPIFPFHAWMPRVIENGDTFGISVFLVGLKPVAFGLLRFSIPLLPDAATAVAPMMGAIGFAGMVYGALVALVQTDLRRMLAFACVSHMGAVVMGLAAMNEAAFLGTLMQLGSLGVAITGMFMIAGFLHRRLGSGEVPAASGLHSRAPFLSLAFLLMVLGGVGMPGTSGFNGEHLIMLGALKAHWALAAGIGLTTLLTAAYLLTYYQRVFLRSTEGIDAPLADLDVREGIACWTICVLVLGMGLVSSPFVQVMEQSTRLVAERVSAGKPAQPWFLSGARTAGATPVTASNRTP